MNVALSDCDTDALDPRDEIVMHLKPMRAFALSLTRDVSRADDLVQDTVVKAWTNIDKFQAGTNMRAWLFTILRNTFYSQMRKRGREVQDTEGAFTARLSVPPSHDGVMDMADFKHALSTLPDEQREALLLVGERPDLAFEPCPGRLLGGKRLGLGNALAAMLGVVTPFCSCSAVPLFIGFVESVSVAQTLAAKRRQRITPDQELIGLGAANIGAAFTGGFPVTGGFSRSVVNYDAGAETPAAGAYTAVGLAIAALALTPLIFFLPKATLAATIIVAVLSLVDFSILKKTWGYSKADFIAVAATIQQQSGGNLAEILHGLAKVIRARFKLFRRVKAITAEAKWSGMFLSLFPILALVMINVIQPNYYDDVKQTSAFIPACLVVAAFLTVNIFVMRMLVNIKV